MITKELTKSTLNRLLAINWRSFSNRLAMTILVLLKNWRRYWNKKPGFLPTGFLGTLSN